MIICIYFHSEAELICIFCIRETLQMQSSNFEDILIPIKETRIFAKRFIVYILIISVSNSAI